MLIEVNEQHDANLHLQMIEHLADYAIRGNFSSALMGGFLKIIRRGLEIVDLC